MLRVPVVGEGEGMKGTKPAMVSVATVTGTSNLDHVEPPFQLCRNNKLYPIDNKMSI
jgi:hypothetical protein